MNDEGEAMKNGGPGERRFRPFLGSVTLAAMAILGAHMSIAGGYHKAVEIAARAGCDCVQLFTKNRPNWRFQIAKQNARVAACSCIGRAGLLCGAGWAGQARGGMWPANRGSRF